MNAMLDDVLRDARQYEVRRVVGPWSEPVEHDAEGYHRCRATRELAQALASDLVERGRVQRIETRDGPVFRASAIVVSDDELERIVDAAFRVGQATRGRA